MFIDLLMELSLLKAGGVGKSEGGLNLNHFLSLDRPATFVFRVGTNAFCDEGIFKGDFVVLRRDLMPSRNSLIVGIKDSDFLLMRRNQIKECKDPSQFMHYRLVGVVSAIFRKMPLTSN